MDNFTGRHRSAVLLLSLVVPLLACVALTPFRASVASTNAALVLVLIVVAAAATGLRFAGMVAAVSGAVSFDFFLTAPYYRLAIDDRADVETAVLLVLVGAAVTEIALWGRRQQGLASRQQGYLTGVLQTVSSVATRGADPFELTGTVAGQMRQVLDVDGCRFTTDPEPRTDVRLGRDGEVTRAGHRVDVVRYGLPSDIEIELPVESSTGVAGRYLITAATRISRPGLEERRVAVALADQIGLALGARGPRAASAPPAGC
jgi:K+-sensing histidine kinase KdpD